MAPASLLVRLLLLGRLVAFMALVYVLFGLVVEALSRKPESKLRAFARLICSPLTRPVAALSGGGLEYPRLLRRTAWAVAALWVVLWAASELALRPQGP